MVSEREKLTMYEAKIAFHAKNADHARALTDRLFDRVCREWNPLRWLGLHRFTNKLVDLPVVGRTFQHNFGFPCWWDIGVGPDEVKLDDEEDVDDLPRTREWRRRAETIMQRPGFIDAFDLDHVRQSLDEEL